MGQTVSELMAQNISNAQINVQTWGGVIYNVKAFGAKGDGVTDDTLAVQKAIDTAIANNAKLVFFPPGTYKVTSLTNTDLVYFVGDNALFSGISTIINEFGFTEVNRKNTYYPIYNVVGYGATGDGSADDTTAIQNALNAARDAGGGVVYVPDGTYLISNSLKIYSNTKFVLSPNAVIKRNADIDNMLINGTGGVNGYDGDHDIKIIGGTWDANKDQFPSNVTAIAFGHCKNITIRDCTIKNVYGWHHVELNAVQNGRIINVNFLDFDDVSTREMLQLDLMLGSAQFPWFGNYDKTPCQNIIIQGCLFKNGYRGIGSHSSSAGFPHKNIRIIGNHFENLRGESIYGYNYHQAIVMNNTFEDCHRGIVFVVSSQDCYDITAQGNTLYNFNKNNQSRGILIQGNSTYRIYNVSVVGNILRNINRHGIGLDYCTKCTVADNIVTSCGQNGLWIYRTHRSTIKNNVIIENNTLSGGGDDIRIGADSGVNTDSEDHIVEGNIAGQLKIWYANRVIVTNNNLVSYATIGGAGEVRKFNNYINGVWTP